MELNQLKVGDEITVYLLENGFPDQVSPYWTPWYCVSHKVSVCAVHDNRTDVMGRALKTKDTFTATLKTVH